MNGLFIGLITLDCIYLVEHFPNRNEKMVALDQVITAGGPATNAAITFSYLGNQATLLGVLGNHPMSELICGDLVTYAINIIDLDPYKCSSPAVSSVIVTKSTGERAVISINATKSQSNRESVEWITSDVLQDVDIILIDGHQMMVSQAIAQQAKLENIPIVIDGGSWKNGFDLVLPYVDYAICSANFYPPNCQTTEDVLNYLQSFGISHIAITQGEESILYWEQGISGEIEVSKIQAVDTLGAGDIFHGSFCYYILQKNNFVNALKKSAEIASYSCQFFGTRQWMNRDF